MRMCFTLLVFVHLCMSAGCSQNAQPSVTVGADRGAVVGVPGIRVEIPKGAVKSEVTLTARAVEDISDAMQRGVSIVGDVYGISGYEGRFQEPVTITLSYDPAEVSEGGLVYPAYWDGESWIAMLGDVRDTEVVVYTSHLSVWAILFVYDDAAWETEWYLIAMKEACRGIFWEDDLWSVRRWEAMAEFVGPYLEACPTVARLEATGPPVDEVVVAGATYRIVPTNLPKLTDIMDGEYSETEGELWVEDASGRLVEDKELAFKALFVHEYREFFTDSRVQQTSERCDELVELLQQASIFHGAGSLVDILQSVLSEVLSHHVTQTPYSPTELLRADYLLAIEGFVCRAETRLYMEELRDLPAKLEAYDADRTTYEDLSELYAGYVDCWQRLKPVYEYLTDTFPAYEENIALYTLKKVGKDFAGAFLTHEAGVYAHKAVDLRFTPEHARHFAEVTAWLTVAQAGQNALAASEVIFHALGLLSDNPLANYYEYLQAMGYIPLDPAVIVAYVGCSVSPPAPTEAGMVGANLRRTGEFFGCEGVRSNPEEVWSLSLDGPLGPPVVACGRVFVGGAHRLYVLDAESGALEWQSDWPMPFGAGIVAPAVASGMVLLVCEDAWLRALQVDNGRQLWSTKAAPGRDDMFNANPAVASGLVLYGSEERLYAHDAATGELLWTYEGEWQFDSAGGPSPAVDSGLAYYNDTSGVNAVNLHTGELVRRYPTGSLWDPVVVDGGFVYVSFGGVAAYDVESGEKVFSSLDRCPSFTSGLTVADGKAIYVGCEGSSNILVCVDARSGRETWRYSVPVPPWSEPCSSPVVANGTLYTAWNRVSTVRGSERTTRLFALDVDTGDELWSLEDAGTPAVLGNTIYVGSHDGTLRAMRESAQRTGRIYGYLVHEQRWGSYDSDKRIWVDGLDDGDIVVMVGDELVRDEDDVWHPRGHVVRALRDGRPVVLYGAETGSNVGFVSSLERVEITQSDLAALKRLPDKATPPQEGEVVVAVVALDEDGRSLDEQGRYYRQKCASRGLEYRYPANINHGADIPAFVFEQVKWEELVEILSKAGSDGITSGSSGFVIRVNGPYPETRIWFDDLIN